LCFPGEVHAFSALRSLLSQQVAEAELKSLQEQARHDGREIESLEGRIKDIGVNLEDRAQIGEEAEHI